MPLNDSTRSNELMPLINDSTRPNELMPLNDSTRPNELMPLNDSNRPNELMLPNDPIQPTDEPDTYDRSTLQLHKCLFYKYFKYEIVVLINTPKFV